MMSKKTSKILCLALLGVFLLTAGLGCKGTDRTTREYLKPIEINYWRVWDNEDAFSGIIEEYRRIHPNITINYRKFRYEEYEQAILDALAEDRGPDILSIHEGWLKKYQSKLQPMPPQITMAYQEVVGTIKKEVVAEVRTKPTINARQIKAQFADVVYNDVTLDSQVYGLPLSLETLVMFYNKDLLNRAGITTPPTRWDEFQEAAQKISRFNSDGSIRQAGAAIGTGKNVERSFDILSVLMMQNGAQMVDGRNTITMFEPDQNGYNAGIEALRFFIDFANPVKSVYSWNSSMSNSFEAFYSGQVGFVFGYSYHLPTIRARAPRLKLGIAPIPQVNSDVPENYGSYWLETVSKKSAHPNEAWDFILFATKKGQVEKYLEVTGRPTALKALLQAQMQNEDLYAAASQVLTAKTWYNGKDPLAAEAAIEELIDRAPETVDERGLGDLVKVIIQKISQTQ